MSDVANRAEITYDAYLKARQEYVTAVTEWHAAETASSNFDTIGLSMDDEFNAIPDFRMKAWGARAVIGLRWDEVLAARVAFRDAIDEARKEKVIS